MSDRHTSSPVDFNEDSQEHGLIGRIILRWLFTDVIYAVLPLLVIAILTTLLGRQFKEFLFLKEWSFASIVLFGVTVRQSIRLKTTVQRVPRSWTLDIAVQMFMLALILAVIVLSLVVLSEWRLIPQTDALARYQLTIFLVGLICLFATTWIEEAIRHQEERLPKQLPTGWALGRVMGRFESITEELSYLACILQRLASEPNRSAASCGHAALEEARLLADVEHSTAETERLLTIVRRHVDHIRGHQEVEAGRQESLSPCSPMRSAVPPPSLAVPECAVSVAAGKNGPTLPDPDSA
jgi:hypothetical protein